MTDSHDTDIPSLKCCKHRYIERLDHDALIKRLNEIADELYTLTQMCRDLNDQLDSHNSSADAHRVLRELINTSTARIATIKTTIDDSLETLEAKVDSNYSTLAAADTQLANRLNNIDADIADLNQTIAATTLELQDSITSSADDDTPIIVSTATSDNVILSELPSTHGTFKIATDGARNIVTYTANNNTSGIPNHTVILLDESGDTVFPGNVSVGALHGNADTATLADKASRLNTPITISLKDASGENTGSSITTDLSSNITLKVPSILNGTSITGTANRALNDSTGADLVSTYVHKTSVNEEINGTKTFNDVLKGSSIEPKTHTGSHVGTSTVPYEDIYITNIHSVNADIANITGNVTGNASTATKLATARKINGTDFNGTSAITTTKWGAARGISIIDASSTNIGTAVQVDGSADTALKLPSTIKATLTGNASTASKLATARKINGTSFDGSSDITTTKWGTSRSIVVWDGPGEYHGTATAVDGSSDITLRLPLSIVADNFYGIATTARKLNRSITINGTTFDGSANITTTAWGYSRNVQITDNDASHLGEITSVNGTSNITLKLPSTIKATLDGTATSATQFSANTTVTLTGDATGTSAGSKKGWSVPVTLANSGVTAGTYGNTSSTNLATNSDPINIPVITVDAKGRVTRVVNEQHTYTSTVYSANKGIKLTGSTFGLDSSYSGSSTQRYVTGGNLSGNVLHLKTKDFKIDTYGRITSNTTNTDITVDLTSIIPTIADATTSSKGVVQIGDNHLNVTDGIVSVADTVLKSDIPQYFDDESKMLIMSNLGIINTYPVNNWLQRGISFGDLVIQYGNSLLAESIPGDSNRKICTVCYREPVTSTSNFAIGSPLSSYPDDDQCCSVIVDSYGPRSMLMGLGDVDQSTRVRYLAINYKFPIDENKYVSTPEIASGLAYPSDYKDGICFNSNWQGDVYYTLSKNSAGYTVINPGHPVYLVDMFMSANAPSSDYIEFSLEGSTIGSSDVVSIFGNPRLSNTVNVRQEGGRKYFSRGYDINLASAASDGNNTSLTILGYKDRFSRQLLRDSLFSTFIMSSFTLTINDTTNFFNGRTQFRLKFNKSFSSGVKGYIRIFYLGSDNAHITFN